MEYPKISIVIGSYNRLPMLKLCIDAVREELKNIPYEIIVVDGGSTDGALEWLTEQKDIITIAQHNRGEWLGKKIEKKPWAYFMNLGFKCATGKYICMLSDDSLIVPGAILNGADLFDEMLNQNVKLGAVAFYFRDYPVRKEYAVAINIGNLYLNHGLYLREALEDVGFIDESFHFYFADTDLILRMNQKGYKCIASKNSFVEHYFEATPEIRASNTNDKKLADRTKLIERWKGVAYPEEKYDYYNKHVGYWQEHPRGLIDPNRTIDKLIGVCESPTVSIVTVVYNDCNGLKKTIDSVSSLDFDSFEYIVVDGSSTDGTRELIEKYKNIIDKSISEPDDGIYDAMNKAIDLCTGKYVIFMNAGDTFHNINSLNCIFEQVTNPDEDVLYGDRIYIDKEGEHQFQPALSIDELWKKMPYCHQSALYKLEALKSTPFNTTYRFAADYNQIVELYKKGATFKKLDITLSNFQAGGRSESGIRPYLEVLKIQTDNAPKGFANESVYLRGLCDNFDELIGKLKNEN